MPTSGTGSNVTLFAVDHSSRGMLVDGWLPFVALGWFSKDPN